MNRNFQRRTLLDELPSFWNRNIIFIANILSIFFGNQEETQALRREVGSLESYGGRLIPVLDLLCARKGNLLVLEKEPDAALLGYFESLGLSLPEICPFPENFQRKFLRGDEAVSPFLQKLQDHSVEWIGGYVVDETLIRLGEFLGKKVTGSIEGCRNGNNKLLLYHYLVTNRMPVFDTFEAGDFKQVREALDCLRKKGYASGVIKAQIGASGIGMYKIDLSAAKPEKELPPYLFFEGTVLVQGWLDESVPGVQSISSPSVQIFVDASGCWVYDITEQILSAESIHQGNIAPPLCLEQYPEMKERLIEQAHRAGGWLAAQGYAGTASIDFHAVKRDGQVELRACEINARVTGATYPSVLARHFLPGHVWVMRNVRFPAALEGNRILEMLKKAGILFLKGQSQGVLPFNFNARADGRIVKGQFLFLAARRSDAGRLLEQVNGLFSLEGRYDRD